MDHDLILVRTLRRGYSLRLGMIPNLAKVPFLQLSGNVGCCAVAGVFARLIRGRGRWWLRLSGGGLGIGSGGRCGRLVGPCDSEKD